MKVWRKIWVGLLCSLALYGWAGVANKDRQAVVSLVQQMFPDLVVDAVVPTPSPFLFGVVHGTQMIYLDYQHQLAFFGRLIDLKTKHDLTADTKNETLKKLVQAFDLSQAIHFKNGSGQHHLIVFEDPYCQYCRQLTRTLSEMDNIRVDIVLYPMLGGDSLPMSRRILCDRDPYRAWVDWMLHDREPSHPMTTCREGVLQDNLEHGRALGLMVVPVTVFADGQQISGALSRSVIQQMLGVK